MLESRSSYGYGYVGCNQKGFEWLLIYGEKPHERLKSGTVYKTERQAIAEGKKYQKSHSLEEYRNGEIKAVKATSLHFEY